MSKSLQKNIQPQSPRKPPEPSFNNSCWFPTNLLEICNYIINSPTETLQSPTFIFSANSSAAEENWNIIKSFDSNFVKALNSQQDSQLKFGSEFKDPNILELIFINHPLWSRLKRHLTFGCNYPRTELDEKESIQDLKEGLEFGNHKGVANNHDLFVSMINDEVKQGWSVVIPRDKVVELKGAVISPMNIATQLGINESGDMIEKRRLTHNQSMEFSSGTSINSRIIKEEMQGVMYGQCLIRVIHDIVDRRKRFPNSRILVQKVDFKSAYRRAHLSAESAVKTITQCVERNLAFISLRLTFGGSPNPSFWGDFAESICDLSNALFECKEEEWNKFPIVSDIQHLVPKTKPNTDSAPFEQALPLAVSFPSSDNPKADIYIDDITTVTVETEKNVRVAEKAVLLALHTVARQLNANDAIPRSHMVSLSKLAAEAELEETKILLGWQLNTRKLSVSLPSDKFKAWTRILERICVSKESTFDELDSTIGRLTHVSVVVKPMKHFKSRIRQEKKRAENRRKLKLRKEVLEDLILHQKFLKIAAEGINMNLLTFREPSHIYRADACPFGIGGYSATGRAWRIHIPEHLCFRASINMLEHIGSTIGPWVDLLENNLPPLSCILAMTDSTTSAGWLRKSNFQENQLESKEMTAAKLKISRSHAQRILENECTEYSQWFPGEDNELADSLSRDFHLTDSQLICLFNQKIPKQTPSNLKISPLPQEIVSFLFSLLQTLPENTQRQERLSRSKISRGIDGKHSYPQLASLQTHSSPTSPKEAKTSSPQPLQNQSEQENI